MVKLEVHTEQPVPNTTRNNVNYRNTDEMNRTVENRTMEEFERSNSLSINEMDLDYIINQDHTTTDDEKLYWYYRNVR